MSNNAIIDQLKSLRASTTRTRTGVRRDERLMFPVTADERNAIKKLATAGGTSLSEFCRNKLLGTKPAM